MKIQCDNPEAVVKEAFWLAWIACARAQGMGVLQDRPGVSKEDVWNNVRSAGDYSPGAKELTKADKPGEARGDYVFGRMMKLSLKWDATGVEFRDETPTLDYQAWAWVYRSYEALVRSAIENLKHAVEVSNRLKEAVPKDVSVITDDTNIRITEIPEVVPKEWLNLETAAVDMLVALEGSAAEVAFAAGKMKVALKVLADRRDAQAGSDALLQRHRMLKGIHS